MSPTFVIGNLREGRGRAVGRTEGADCGQDGKGMPLPVMPARSPSVMPDGFYRASSVFSLPHHPVRLVMPAPSRISSEDGFPLKTCGNDRRGNGKDAEGAASLLSCPQGLLLSCPTVVIGHPVSFLFPSSGTSCHARPPWISSEDGFPLKTCGNDRRGNGKDGRGSLSPVMPDGFYRASSVLSSPASRTPCHARPPWISSEDGFPLKTCGNDRRGNGKDGRGRLRAGREGDASPCHARKVSFCHARRLLSGIQCLFSSPSSGTPCHACPPGFPLKMDSR